MNLLTKLLKEDEQALVEEISKLPDDKLKYKTIYKFMLENFCNFEPDSPYDYVNEHLQNLNSNDVISTLDSVSFSNSVTQQQNASQLLCIMENFNENVAKLYEKHIKLNESNKANTKKKYIADNKQLADTYTKLCNKCHLPCYVCYGEKPTLYGVKQKCFNAIMLNGYIRFADIATDLSIFENPYGTPRVSNDIPLGSYFNRSLSEMVILDGYKGRKLYEKDKIFFTPLTKGSIETFNTPDITDREREFFKNNFIRNLQKLQQPAAETAASRK